MDRFARNGDENSIEEEEIVLTKKSQMKMESSIQTSNIASSLISNQSSRILSKIS
jgi:hypothetical protein